MFLDIVILPPKKLRAKVAKLVKKAIGKRPSFFIVDDKHLTPHLSIYHIMLSLSRLEELMAGIKKTIANFHPFYFYMASFETTTDGVVQYRFKLNTDYKNLQGKTVRNCAGLREGMVPWVSNKAPSKQQAKFRKKYGSSYLLPFLPPHFTMAKLKNSKDVKQVVTALRLGKFKFLADTIAICMVNNFGQVIKIIKTFKLQ